MIRRSPALNVIDLGIVRDVVCRNEDDEIEVIINSNLFRLSCNGCHHHEHPHCCYQP